MSVETTTLPAAPANGAPIRRRVAARPNAPAVEPGVALAGNPEPVQPELPEQPEMVVTHETVETEDVSFVDPPLDVASEQPEAVVAKRGRGRPRKDTVIQTVAPINLSPAKPAARRGRPRKDAVEGAVAAPKAPRAKKPVAEIDPKSLGELYLAARRANVTVEAYAYRMRGMLAAYDALNAQG